MNVFYRYLKLDQWYTWRFGCWLFRSIFSWRTLRRLLVGVAVLATLIALLYTVENWRGRRAWKLAKQELEAHGEHTDLAAFVPPMIPDDQNFAMAPLWRDVPGGDYHHLEDNNGWFRVRSPFSIQPPFFGAFGNWLAAKPADLRSWQQYYRDLDAQAKPRSGRIPPNERFPIPDQTGVPGADVLLALSRYEARLAQLREAALRPASRFPLRYEDGINMRASHYSLLQSATVYLKLRALAELEVGRTDAAFEDTKLHFRLVAAIRSEPLAIAHLVRISMIDQALATIWQGMASHRWTDRQLADFQDELKKLDFLADYDLCMRFERLPAFETLQYMERSRDPIYFRNISGSSWGLEEPLRNGKAWAKIYRWMPSGWFEQNEATYADLSLQRGSCRASPSEPFVPIDDWRRRCDRLLSDPNDQAPYHFLAIRLIAWGSTSSPSFIQSEANVRLARTACALERYRIARGSYPETLDSLAPRFIPAVPVDVINGGRLKYRRTDDQHFVLYSIGWNGKDDGGEAGVKRGGSVDIREGDWVWKYPP